MNDKEWEKYIDGLFSPTEIDRYVEGDHFCINVPHIARENWRKIELDTGLELSYVDAGEHGVRLGFGQHRTKCSNCCHDYCEGCLDRADCECPCKGRERY